MSARGLFLDLDGTLADSIGVLYDAYLAFLGEHGRQGTPAEFDELNGVRMPRAIELLVEHHRLESETDHLARYEALVDETYALAEPCPGAHELVARARSLDYRIAVVTSGTRERAAAWLRASELFEDGDRLVSAESVQRGKPDPEPYLLALRQTGAERARSLAVEDSRAGALAATGAGLATWIVTPEDVDWPGIRGRVTTLEDLLPRLADV